jgi:hypothetical protein
MRRSRYLAPVFVAVTLIACRPDAPLGTSPITASVLCDEDPVLCGPVDGTIHDGTGNGSVTHAPGDPSPGSPGVWLGHYVTGRYCYADYNSFMRDDDLDWLDDQCEYELAKAFAPVLAIHPQDGCSQGEPYWAAKYFDDPGYGWGEFVRIGYMPAYYVDCGSYGHNGDSEAIMIDVHQNTATLHWELRHVYLSAHQGTFTNSSDFIRDPSGLEFPAHRLAYPRVWVARAKHANYRSRDACNSGAYGFDSCDGNTTVGRLRIYKHRNVGSRFVDWFPDGVASGNPAFSQNGRREYFYTPQNFRGWQTTGDGVSPYASFLYSLFFERYDYTYVFGGGTWYAGPGPDRPGRTTLTGVVDGPRQVTAYQTYTWTSFVTGGQLPYRAEWWRRYASQSTATLVGTSTNDSPFTAGSWVGTVDRCENFTLTLKIWSTDGQYWYDNHDVAVTCPPPPLTAYIDGPDVITSKGTYTWEAMPAGGVGGYTYAWSIYYPATATGWSLGTAKTQTKTVYADDEEFELRVTVRSGSQATTTTLLVRECIGSSGSCYAY